MKNTKMLKTLVRHKMFSKDKKFMLFKKINEITRVGHLYYKSFCVYIIYALSILLPRYYVQESFTM